MRTASYRVSDLQRFTIPLGFVGENEHCQIIFLAEDVYQEYPHAAASLTVRPPYGEPYPAVVTRDGNNVVWTVKDSDLTRSGQGELQLSFTTGEIVAKTYVGKTKICRSIQPTGDVPDPLEDFLTEAGAALTAIPETIDQEFEAIQAVAQTLEPGSQATASFDGETKVLTIGVPEGDKGDPGQDGADGLDGYTPQRGVDYWTPADQAAMLQDIAQEKADAIAAIENKGTQQVGLVTDEGTTQKAAVQAKGTEVIESIPSDYSELSEDVSALKIAINVLEPQASSSDVGKFLKAKTVTDGKVSEYEFGEASGGGVSDVKVNGTSVVSQGVANVPVAIEYNTLGVVKVPSGEGLIISSTGSLTANKAITTHIKAANSNALLTAARVHETAFFGLAKAAGDSTQSSSNNSVGTYTEDALSKISDMLNAPVSVSGSTPSITAKAGVRYICGECSTLTVVVPATGIIDVVFESGSTPTVLTVTPPTGQTMKWANGFDPTALEANTTYEINIANGCLGVAGTWT